MALTRQFPPKGASEYGVDPVPLNAVPGEASLKGGDRAEIIGTPEPLPVTIFVNGENLADIIAALRADVDALG